MNITQRRIIHDHGTEQRKQAIRAWEQKDDAKGVRTFGLLGAVLAAVFVVAVLHGLGLL